MAADARAFINYLRELTRVFPQLVIESSQNTFLEKWGPMKGPRKFLRALVPPPVETLLCKISEIIEIFEVIEQLMIKICQKDGIDISPSGNIQNLVNKRIGTNDGTYHSGNVKLVSNPYSITQTNGFIMADKVGRWFEEICRII